MTLCPGRKGSSIEGGSWDRDLGLDLEVVRAWRPSLVLALLEDHEYASLGIAHFKEAVFRAGLPWDFAPIPDGGVPGLEFDLAWGEIAPRSRQILDNGGRILIHCRAGLGRTGLVAACLLVDFGATSEEAIDAVRTARPSAIETSEQERYIRSRATDD
jgi:ADP-ribosyl-[dinitrogen reductase] hydrolase